MLKLNIIYPEEIRMDQNPKKNQWNLIPLYKEDIDGYSKIYQIKFDGNNLYEIDNEITRKINYIDDPVIYARKIYREKQKAGYYPPGNPITINRGMKGYNYKQGSIKSWPVYTQPKINGIRMLSQINNKDVNMKSWLNNKFNHLNHIESELKDFFEYLPRYCVLDGELYNHDITFTDLTRAIKTTTSVDPLLISIQYWIFDVVYEDYEGTPYEKRYELLVNAYRNYIFDGGRPIYIRIVPSEIAMNHQDILSQHDKHLQNGYEGIMIKKISNGNSPGNKIYEESLYKQDKCNHILKYKSFSDEEVTILDVKDNNIIVKDERNNIFSLTVPNSQIYINNINRKLTIRYSSLSSKGIPMNPIIVGIRDYE